MGWGKPNGGFTVADKHGIEDAGDLPATGGSSVVSQVVPPTLQTSISTKPLGDAQKSYLSQLSDVKSVQVDEPTAVDSPDGATITPDPFSSMPMPATAETTALPPPPEKPVVDDGSTGNKTEEEKYEEAIKNGFQSWLEYMKFKANQIKDKIASWWGSVTGSSPPS